MLRLLLGMGMWNADLVDRVLLPNRGEMGQKLEARIQNADWAVLMWLNDSLREPRRKFSQKSRT